MNVDLLLATFAGYLAVFGLSDRPQDPKVRDYTIETVRIRTASGTAILDAELTLPKGAGHVPAVVLITGSGPQDKNEEIAGHKPFLVLSDHLTKSGYAVLRYDDRGVGRSTGDFATATPQDLASDAAAALAYVKSHPRVLSAKAGYIGHSEGGYLAPIAQQIEPAAFHVYLAGPALPLVPDVMRTQVQDIGRAEGLPDDVIARQMQAVNDISAALLNSATPADLHRLITTALRNSGASGSQVRQNLAVWATPWAAAYARHDPLKQLAGLSVPVLALFGEHDLQVSASENVPIMRKALTHPLSDVRTLPGLNHLFQPTRTGRIDEYIRIATTIDPIALEAIATWLDAIVKVPANRGNRSLFPRPGNQRPGLR